MKYGKKLLSLFVVFTFLVSSTGMAAMPSQSNLSPKDRIANDIPMFEEAMTSVILSLEWFALVLQKWN